MIGKLLVYIVVTILVIWSMDAVNINQIFKKNHIKFSGIPRTFIFGSFFIAREIQKIDRTWHFILFYCFIYLSIFL